MSTEKENKFDEFDKYYDTYDLTSEELSYYLEVQSRVLKKLSEIQYKNIKKYLQICKNIITYIL